MNTLLKTIKQTPVSKAFLKSRLPNGVKVVSYTFLKGKHRREVFSNNKPVVVLIPKKGEKVGHFIVLLPWPRHIEYFSSLGGSPQSELAALDEPLDIMKRLLGKQFVYNRTQLQSGDYHINDCASWVLARVYLSHIKLRQFVQLFQRRTLSTPDDVVAMMTLLHFVSK